jgi:hypothetical protein
MRRYLHDVSAPVPDAAKIEEFSTENVSLLANITQKAAKLAKLDSEAKIDEFSTHMVRHYLQGESAIDALRERDAEQFESLLRCKQAKEDQLEIQSMLQTGDASTVMTTFTEFKVEVEKNVSVSPHTTEVVAWGAVADWLLRCPLDF